MVTVTGEWTSNSSVDSSERPSHNPPSVLAKNRVTKGNFSDRRLRALLNREDQGQNTERGLWREKVKTEMKMRT